MVDMEADAMAKAKKPFPVVFFGKPQVILLW